MLGLSESVAGMATPRADAAPAGATAPEPSPSHTAESFPPTVDTHAQNPLPIPSSAVSVNAKLTEPHAAQSTPLPDKNYFMHAQNLLSRKNDTVTIAAPVLNSGAPDSTIALPKDSTPLEMSSPPSESAAPFGFATVDPNAADDAPLLNFEPQPAPAEAPMPTSVSHPVITSAMEASSPSPKKSSASDSLHDYFPNRDIFSAKPIGALRSAAQSVSSPTSIGEDPRSSSDVNLVENASGGERGSASLSPDMLGEEQRDIRALIPSAIFSGMAATKDVPAPALTKPTSSMEQPQAATTATATVVNSVQHFSGPQILAPAPTPTAPPPSAPSLSSGNEPQTTSPSVSSKDGATADGSTVDTSAESANASHYDSTATLAARVLAELTARKQYPAAALRRRTEGTVTLLLSVEKDGRLAAIVFQTRSGSSILDEAALSLARGIFPIDIHLADPATIVVPIEYRIPK